MSFNLDIVLGPLLVGTWTNSVLYAVEVIQAAYYYRHFKQDNWMWKLLVSSVIDSVSMIANYASVYLYTITHWGDLTYLQNHLTRSTCLRLAQWPLWPKVSWLRDNWLLNKVITLTLFFFITVAVGGAFRFCRHDRPFLVNNNSNVPTGIAYCLGRVYCITMLANLNSRKAGNTWSSKGTSSGANPDTRDERGNLERSEGGDEYGGIHVHQTAVVHIETPQEFSRGSFKTNPGQGSPDDSLAVEMEITVNDSASYSARKKQDLFAP
ncbi:hypothetical protein B0H14DRAFT_3462295 [Mycena olivaceomarginata]|nr:hypothetical protein B0H14DRAFT_3462295 [Mycena olivaceomarginata]